MRRLAAVAAVACAAAACSKAQPSQEILDEKARRDAYRIHTLAVEDAGRAGQVSSRPDVIFEEDFSNIKYDPPAKYRNHAFRWFGRNAHVRLKSHGDRPMRVKVLGWFDYNALKTHPSIAFYIDGRFVFELPPVPDDMHFWAEFVVPRELLRDRAWVDLHIVPSSIAFHWAEPPALMAGLITDFEWTEAP